MPFLSTNNFGDDVATTGCMIHEKRYTAEGLEYNFAVNVFGTSV